MFCINITIYLGIGVSENCPMETVSGKLEIRVIDRHLSINDNNYDKSISQPIVCSKENNGLFE